MRRFARPEDFRECARLHRQHGTTYYHASRLFPARLRPRVHALYGFVRVPDEWVDNPGELTVEDRRQMLVDFRRQMLRGVEGVEPVHPVMRAFVDVQNETGMGIEEPLCFLDAMEQDLTIHRYPTYGDLWGYMRGSAAAVGLMMLQILGLPQSPENRRGAIALGNAMQLTNFLRDVGEDAGRGRIYLPREDLDSFGVTEEQVMARAFDSRMDSLMRFQIARARALYAEGDSALRELPRETRRPVLLARVLYSRILDRLEQQGGNPFLRRARTDRIEKLVASMQVWLRPEAVFQSLRSSPRQIDSQPKEEQPQ